MGEQTSAGAGASGTPGPDAARVREAPADLVSWESRVAYAAEGFAYRPGQVLVRESQVEEAQEVLRTLRVDARPEDPVARYVRFSGKFDALRAVEELRLEGLTAVPNVVLFADCCGGCSCPPHPALCAAG